MATLLSTIETEVGNLSTKTRFEYAGDLEEANANIFDRLAVGDFPVCLILAFDTVDDGRENGRVKSSAEINALFLNKAAAPTSDSKTSEIETEIIAPMRALAREFINRLDANDIVEEEGISSVTHRNTFQALMDAHLFGNWAFFTIKFSEDTTTCLPS